MRRLFLHISLITSLMLPGLAQGDQSSKRADLQFFGDFFLPFYVMRATKSTRDDPKLFQNIRSTLDSATWNIINFEGVATEAFVPYEQKKFLLKMPTYIPKMIFDQGINAATLANNHIMDFGYQGLFDTMVSLERAGILHSGAGSNLSEATEPMILQTQNASVCILSYSRTLPESFWAKESKPGSSSLNFSETGRRIKACADQGHLTIAVFHWGAELATQPKKYQKQLAHLAIDSGAQAVIGHHPHVIQLIDQYKGKPVFYSLGNFFFGTLPMGRNQTGMSVRAYIDKNKSMRWEVYGLNVNNDDIKYIPERLNKSESRKMKRYMAPSNPCTYNESTNSWWCG